MSGKRPKLYNSSRDRDPVVAHGTDKEGQRVEPTSGPVFVRARGAVTVWHNR